MAQFPSPKKDSISTDADKPLLTFQSFKKDYLQLITSHKSSQKRNDLLQNQIALLENKIKLLDGQPSFAEISELQEKILKYIHKHDNATKNNLNETLQEKVQSLETRLQTQKESYEREIKSISEKNSREIADLRNENHIKEKKIRELETACQDTSRKNDALNVVLETFGLETENEMTTLKEKYNQDITLLKEAKIKLEAENKLLIEKFIHQEKFYKGRLQLLEKHNNEFIQTSTNKSKRKFMQTLNEAFVSNQNSSRDFQSPEPQTLVSGNVLFTPYVTDTSIMKEFSPTKKLKQ